MNYEDDAFDGNYGTTVYDEDGRFGVGIAPNLNSLYRWVVTIGKFEKKTKTFAEAKKYLEKYGFNTYGSFK